MSSKNYEELLEAVVKGDASKVKSIVASGADVNFVMEGDCEMNTLLHYAPNTEVTKELLLQGADVNARNIDGFTPLHYAVIREKGLNVVQELLKNGAIANALDRIDNTPIVFAIYYKNLEVIKELLEYGANVNLRRTPLSHQYPTTFGIAVSGYEECAKLIIKIILIKNFENDYKKIVNLDYYVRSPNYSVLSCFFDACVSEINLMKIDKFHSSFSLYDFVIGKGDSKKPFYMTNNEIEQELSRKYPIYHDIILPKIKMNIERAYLLKKLTSIEIYSLSDIFQKQAVLNNDCIYNLAEYLSNTDLKIFITAFQESLDS